MDTLFIENVEHLTEVVLTYYIKYRGDTFPYPFTLLSDTLSTPGRSSNRVLIDIGKHLAIFKRTYGKLGYEATGRVIRVSSAGPDWRYPVEINDDILTLPEGISNIENGIGYEIGIINKTIQYKEGLELFSYSPPPVLN